MSKNQIAILTVILFIMAPMLVLPVYAFPSEESDCSTCHGPSFGTYVILVTATPSKTNLSPGETYTVNIVIGENPSGSEDQTGYWIANSDAANATGTSTGVYGGPSTSHTYTATMTANSTAGTYYYKVFGQDGHFGSAGAAGWGVYSITVIAAEGNQPPHASFALTSRDLTVEFTDQSSDPDDDNITWFWDFGDGTNSTEQNPTHLFPEMDTYQVMLKVTDDRGDSSTASEILTVPSKGERMQLWITQVSIITIAIAFISFIAVLTARKIEAKKEGEKHGSHT